MVRPRLLIPFLGAGAGGALGFGLALRRARRSRTTHPALAGAPLLIAHRGGAGLAPENTLTAFHEAADDWAADMIELDVRASADGHCVVIHDPTVDRTTDGVGIVEEMTLDELRRLDAGYRFTPDGGRTFPYRGRGCHVPTIDEVLAELPSMRLTVEVKVGAAQRPLFEAIARASAQDRVIAAGESESARTEFAHYRGPTSASAERLRRCYILHRLHLGAFWTCDADAAQMPELWDGRRILTPALVEDLHRHGMAVHVWTVNDPDDMQRLLDWGVDGLVTDRPDLLAEILAGRSGRTVDPPLSRARPTPVE